MIYFNYNGKLFPESTAVIGPGNRGLRYGDGLFETIKYSNGNLILTDEHFARLWKGLRLLNFQLPKLFTPGFLQNEIIQLLAKNNHHNARVRLTIIRGNGGLYDPKNHLPNYFIETIAMDSRPVTLNDNGLQLCIYESAKKSIDAFSNLKHNNFLPYAMGALHAKQLQCNDAIILNTNADVCDSTIANVFMVKNGNIFTPALSEGCIAGTMRRLIIQQLNSAGYEILETTVTTNMLLEADEIFLTNSIYNLRWAAGVDDRKYTNAITQTIFNLLRETISAEFC